MASKDAQTNTPGAPVAEAALSRASVLRARFVHGCVSLLLFIAALSSLPYLHSLPALFNNSQARIQGSLPAHDRLQAHIASHQLERLRTAIRTYKLNEGQLPESLQALTASGLLRESDLRYPQFKESYLYATEGEDSFTLAPPPR